MTRTITRRIATVAATAATLACVALTTVAGTGAALAGGPVHNPPSMHLASQYMPQERAAL